MTPRFALLFLVLAAGPALAEQDPLLTAPPPFQPQVDDPMLTPAPSASKQVGTWEEALGLVRERSTDLRIAEANVQRAEGRWRQALATLLPNGRVSAGVATDLLNPGIPVGLTGAPLFGQTDTERRPTVPLVSGSVSLTQSVVDFSAWRGLSSASAAEDGAQANLQDVQRRLTLGLARTLVATVAAERAAEINRVGLRRALERAALTQRSFELGAGNQLDVVRVRQDVEVARQALISGDEQLRRAREALGLALGVDGAVGVAPALTGEALLAELAGHCRPLRGDEARADLAAAEAAVDAAHARRAQARAGALPTVDLVTTVSAYTATDPAPAYVPSWTVALVLELPLWEGGLRKAAVAERAAAEQDAALIRADVQRTAGFEIARARRGGEVAGALVAAATEARALAERVDTMTRRSFEIGRATSLELVQSAAALRAAELTLSLREFERLAAEVDALLTEARCVP
jgi:outer membrane protein TolC